MDELLTDFKAAMENHGIITQQEIIPDGKIHRFHVDGDAKGKNNGWYVFYPESGCGVFGSWKTGQQETFKSESINEFTPDQLAKIKEAQAKREAETKETQEKTAKKCRQLWSQLNEPKSHPYLTSKEIKSYGLRQLGDELVIPVYDEHHSMCSLQYIGPYGDKRFEPGGKMQGGWFLIGEPKAPFLLCEGYATGASLHAATDLPVIIAFNASNIKPVAEAWSNNRIVICADNDQWTKKPIENPGVHYARLAATACGGSLAIPTFKHATDSNKLTDFNDLAQTEGLPRVAEIVEAAIKESPELLSEMQNGKVNSNDPTVEPVDQSTTADEMPTKTTETLGRGFCFNIEDWPTVHYLGKRKTIPPTVENVIHLLKCNDIKAGYDVIRKDISIVIPQEQYLKGTEHNCKLIRIVSLANTVGMQRSGIENLVEHICKQNPFNPVIDWVKNKPWDGQSRLNDFYETVEAVGEEDEKVRGFKEILLRKWMISAIAAAFEPNGVSAHGVLVFCGEQYIGKTKWFRSLVPQELGLTKEGHLLDPKEKDSVYQAMCNWLVELGELDATFRKAEIAQLKAFVTLQKDVLRLPFERKKEEHPRKTVFFGSVNQKDYLNDPTGNRRFWTIDCKSIDHSHSLDMQQVWAEFYELFKRGESYYLSSEEMLLLNSHNKDFESSSPIEELVHAKYEWDAPVKMLRALTATEIAIELGFKNPTKKDIQAVSKALKDKTGRTWRKSNGRKLFDVPNLINPNPQ